VRLAFINSFTSSKVKLVHLIQLVHLVQIVQLYRSAGSIDWFGTSTRSSSSTLLVNIHVCLATDGGEGMRSS
jgi:hypothetical protein